MKRRSTLYIVNFIIPVLFFLCLDLSSFLISDQGGEKLSFKVTVLLAVTVMQLILNEILPSTSNRIPLIALYCIGIFGLMLLSLLETIVVMYLIEKDNKNEEENLNEDCTDKEGKTNHHFLGEVNKLFLWDCGRDVSPNKTPSKLLSITEEGSSNQLTEDSQSCEKIPDELTTVLKTLILILNSKQGEREPGYWAKKARTINRVFFIFYVTSAALFVLFMSFKWYEP